MSASARDSAAALTIKQEVDRRQQQSRRLRRQQRLRLQKVVIQENGTQKQRNARQRSRCPLSLPATLPAPMPRPFAPLPPTTMTTTTTTHIDKVVNLQSAVPSVDMSIHAHTHTLTSRHTHKLAALPSFGAFILFYFISSSALSSLLLLLLLMLLLLGEFDCLMLATLGNKIGKTERERGHN